MDRSSLAPAAVLAEGIVAPSYSAQVGCKDRQACRRYLHREGCGCAPFPAQQWLRGPFRLEARFHQGVRAQAGAADPALTPCWQTPGLRERTPDAATFARPEDMPTASPEGSHTAWRRQRAPCRSCVCQGNRGPAHSWDRPSSATSIPLRLQAVELHPPVCRAGTESAHASVPTPGRAGPVATRSRTQHRLQRSDSASREPRRAAYRRRGVWAAARRGHRAPSRLRLHVRDRSSDGAVPGYAKRWRCSDLWWERRTSATLRAL